MDSGRPRGRPFSFKDGRTQRIRLIVAALAALAAVAVSPASAQVTREQVDRLIGIALVTDWVTANCETDRLSGMLLVTASSALKQLEPEKLALGRKRVADRAAGFASKDAACERWIADLVAVQ